MAISVSLTLLLTGTQLALADSGLAVDSAGARTLTGNNGGAIDSFNFTVPQPVAAPTVTVTFTPSTLADGNQAGFVVRLDGTQVGTGGPTSTPGVLSYTLPQTPTGVASVQVFAYSAIPSAFTIQTTGVPSNVANGPAANNNTAAQAVPVNGTLSESLPAATGGAFAYFIFPSPGASPPTTVSLSYSPADARVNQAVGFNVIDAYGNNIGSATQPANQNLASATLTLDLSRTSGESLAVQVFNYAQGVPITYRLTVSGVAPAFATAPVAASPSAGTPSTPPPVTAAAPGFQPFWVENFVTTPIWSGPDAAAISPSGPPANA
jgi:hypothetical protein